AFHQRCGWLGALSAKPGSVLSGISTRQGSTVNHTRHQTMMKTRTALGQATLRLLQLDQGAVEVLGVQEQNRLVMGTEPGLAVAQHARALASQPVAGGQDIVHLVADVMDAAGGIALEIGAERRSLAQGLQELDLGV